jgi:bifunctional UDP-N-acetylglucosamine pyrophosphorylase/glucosamine-1-phosphate N-acetyltransferase
MVEVKEAVVVVAGPGTRLAPIIGEIPKSMVRYNHKPLLEYILTSLRDFGVENFVLVVNFKKEVIIDYFGDGRKFGINIQYIVQKNPKGGTADAVGYAKGKVQGKKFFVIYGDNIFNPEILDEILAKTDRYDGVLCGKEMQDVTQYGTFRIEGDLVKEIAEKSSNPPSKIAFTGLMILPKAIFDAIDKTKISERGQKELTESIAILSKKGFKLGYVAAEKFWIDPRNKEDLYEVEKFYKSFETT